MGKKQPKIKSQSPVTKIPKLLNDPEFGRDKEIIWKFGHMVCNSERRWSWNSFTNGSKVGEVFKTLGDLEKMKFNEINTSPGHHHSIKVSSIIRKAQRELEILELDDHESLFSLAICGKIRVWCLFNENMFCPLWYDPDHEIYHSSKRN